MKDEELFKVAVDTLKFEIQMFWQRSNYFMVLNTAIAVGFFSGKAGQYTWVLSCLGILVSLLWYFVTLGKTCKTVERFFSLVSIRPARFVASLFLKFTAKVHFYARWPSLRHSVIPASAAGWWLLRSRKHQGVASL